MSEYAQVQTYATCNERTYAMVASHYRLVLEQLGCTDTQVLQWLDALQWPASEDDGLGDIYAVPFVLTLAEVPTKKIVCAGIEVTLYIDAAIPSIEEPPIWVGFNLLFETETLRTDATAPYSIEAGASLWRIVQKQAGAFRELGAYFTDEWQENQSWRAITAHLGDPWAFDLAIFPRSRSECFSEVPAGFKGTVTPQGFGFARVNRWQQLPWDWEMNYIQHQAEEK